MEKTHYDSRNKILCWTIFRLVLIPAKFIFGLIIFRWEFMANTFVALFITLFYLAAVSSLQVCCSVIMWLAEIGFNCAALIYFIVLATSPFASKLFWFTCVFIALDLIILVSLSGHMMNFMKVRKLPAYTRPPRVLQRVTPPQPRV